MTNKIETYIYILDIHYIDIYILDTHYIHVYIYIQVY